MGTLARHLEEHLGGMQRSARLLNERAAALGDERLGRNAASLLQAAKKMSDFVALQDDGAKQEEKKKKKKQHTHTHTHTHTPANCIPLRP